MNYDFEKIIQNFKVDGSLKNVEPIGEGHINQTFLAVMDNGKEYVIQKINDTLFTDVDGLMGNICKVSEFSRKEIMERGGDPDRESVTVIYAKDNKPYVKTEEGVFRVYLNITNSVAYQVVERPEDFYKNAVAFGAFVNMLDRFDASSLIEVIPDFHNTEKRIADFELAVKEDRCGRAKDVKAEIDFILSRKDYAGRIVKLLNSGEMPVRVTHNDTKLNNVLFDKDTNEPLVVIDLDTVMPGSLCYDFGDSIRFGCNPALEDEPDLSKVVFDINLFEQFTAGYLSQVGDSITKVEKDNLAFSAILITYELASRFLADHLNGDTYFRIKRENHNLDRTRTQLKLVSDMEKVYDKMCEIVNKY